MGFVDRPIPTMVSPVGAEDVGWISASVVRAAICDFSVGSASSRRVYAFMLLEEGIRINANRDYSRIIPHRVDRTGRLHRNPRGGVKRVKPIGGDRQKWELDFSVLFVPGIQVMTAKEFLSWREGNMNFVFAREWNRYPDEVYPATFLDADVEVPYRSGWKLGGNVVHFRVGER